MINYGDSMSQHAGLPTIIITVTYDLETTIIKSLSVCFDVINYGDSIFDYLKIIITVTRGLENLLFTNLPNLLRHIQSFGY